MHAFNCFSPATQALAQRCAKHLLAKNVFAGPFTKRGRTFEGNMPHHHFGFFRDADGSMVRAYSKLNGLESVFNEVAVRVFGHAIGIAINPVVVEMDAEGGAVYSLQVFTNAVEQQAFLGGLDIRPNKQIAALSHTIRKAGEELTHAEREKRFLKAASAQLSALIPAFEWMGGGDFGSSNIILDATAALEHLGKKPPATPLPMHMIDVGDSLFTALKSPHAQTKLPKHADFLCSMVQDWPTISDLTEAMTRRRFLNVSFLWTPFDPDYPGCALRPLLAPYLDFAVMRQTMAQVKAISLRQIGDKTRRIVEVLSRDHPQHREKLEEHADLANVILRARHRNLDALMAPYLEHEGRTPSRLNPFSAFGRHVRHEMDKRSQLRKKRARHSKNEKA